MAMINCPECGTSVSSSARRCPFCGFEEGESGAELAVVEPHQIERVDWETPELIEPFGGVFPFGDRMRSSFEGLFENMDRAQKLLPSFLQLLKELVPQKDLVPVLDKEAREALAGGVARFGIDSKNGKLMACLYREGQKGVWKQVRLEEVLRGGELAGSLAQFQSQFMLVQILQRLEDIHDAIEGIRHEFHLDRMANAEAVWISLNRAMRMTDSRLRASALIDIAHRATEAKAALLREFVTKLQDLKARQGFDFREFVSNRVGQNADQAARNAFDCLAASIRMAQGEACAYSLLDQSEVVRMCLEDFQSELERVVPDKNALLWINSEVAGDKQSFIEDFTSMKLSLNECVRFARESRVLLAGDLMNSDVVETPAAKPGANRQGTNDSNDEDEEDE